MICFPISLCRADGFVFLEDYSPASNKKLWCSGNIGYSRNENLLGTIEREMIASGLLTLRVALLLITGGFGCPFIWRGWQGALVLTFVTYCLPYKIICSSHLEADPLADEGDWALGFGVNHSCCSVKQSPAKFKEGETDHQAWNQEQACKAEVTLYTRVSLVLRNVQSQARSRRAAHIYGISAHNSGLCKRATMRKNIHTWKCGER